MLPPYYSYKIGRDESMSAWGWRGADPMYSLPPQCPVRDMSIVYPLLIPRWGRKWGGKNFPSHGGVFPAKRKGGHGGVAGYNPGNVFVTPPHPPQQL